MGLGKTLQALAAVQHLSAWPCGVVTLATVKDCWKNEVAKWLPGVACHVWSGKTGAPEVHGPADAERVVHVINYDILPARLAEWLELGLSSVVFDESHSCRNGKSKRTKAARELAKRKPVRFCLTGTPSGNAPVELLPQLQMLGRLDDLGGFNHFTTRYLGAKKMTYGWDMSGAKNLGELHEKLRSVCFLRRRKEQVQTELPESIVTKVPIALSLSGKADYNAALKDVKSWIAARAPLKPEFLRSIEGLTPELQEFRKGEEIAAAMERIDGMELLHQFGVLRHACLKAKLPSIVEWLLHHAEGEKLVLFGHHRAGLRDLLPALADVKPLIIDGSVSTGKRAGIMSEFSKKRHRIMLANYQAAGTGLDGLQHCAHHFVCADWPWTPHTLRQAGSRLDRQGQKNTVMQWHLYAPGTIDDDSLELLAEKATTADAITDGDNASRQAEAFRRARVLGGKLIL
jgi:SWI/SNF-related matrix-associated actin-dependent regulator of chromatin subfamily A-like protein 1